MPSFSHNLLFSAVNAFKFPASGTSVGKGSCINFSVSLVNLALLYVIVRSQIPKNCSNFLSSIESQCVTPTLVLTLDVFNPGRS